MLVFREGWDSDPGWVDAIGLRRGTMQVISEQMSLYVFRPSSISHAPSLLVKHMAEMTHGCNNRMTLIIHIEVERPCCCCLFDTAVLLRCKTVGVFALKV